MQAAAGSDAFIANDTVPQAQAVQYYATSIPSLAQTISHLAPAGVNFSPVVVCGFSAGGFATRRILQLGGDPDALVIADGTYGLNPPDWAEWQAYAQRAMAGQRTFLASYTSLQVATSTWHVLSAITGAALPLADYRWQRGNFTVLGYAGTQHQQQGDIVLPMMLRQAMQGLGRSSRAGAVLAAAFGFSALVGLTYGALYAWDRWRS